MQLHYEVNTSAQSKLLHHLTGQLLLFSLPRIFFTLSSSSLNVTFIGKSLAVSGHFLLCPPSIYFIYSINKYLLCAYNVLGMMLRAVYFSSLLIIIQLIHLTPIKYLLFDRLCPMHTPMHCGHFCFLLLFI